MTVIVIARETIEGENRVAATPATVEKLVRHGAKVILQPGLGLAAGFTDEAYQQAGAEFEADLGQLFAQANIVMRVAKPSLEQINLLPSGCLHISFLDPFNERELVEAMQAKGVSAISMEMIPRTTRSQKMDALSSQASLAGYVMVMKAAQYLPSVFPMMMTPAGTIKPAKIFIIGAGVAGLQAIATGKRLGAQVTAFDTRPVVKEQVESLGAKFLNIDLGEMSQTKDGYAVQLTPEQMELQRQGQKKAIAESDIVITTAQVFGRKPPVIVGRDMVEAMKPGSVIIDMAAESGGNVEGSAAGQTVEINGVKLVGEGNWPNQVASDATNMYANNVFNLLDEFWDGEASSLALNLDDDILNGCVIAHAGEIRNPVLRKHYGLAVEQLAEA